MMRDMLITVIATCLVIIAGAMIALVEQLEDLTRVMAQ